MNRTVLVVDDLPEIRDVVRTMLESHGHTVLVAGDAPAAIAAFESNHFDVALVDVDMPLLSGPELLRELLQRSARAGRNFRAVLMTGVLREELHSVARAAGASRILAKPFSMSELIATVEDPCTDKPVTREAA